MLWDLNQSGRRRKKIFLWNIFSLSILRVYRAKYQRFAKQMSVTVPPPAPEHPSEISLMYAVSEGFFYCPTMPSNPPSNPLFKKHLTTIGVCIV